VTVSVSQAASFPPRNGTSLGVPPGRHRRRPRHGRLCVSEKMVTLMRYPSSEGKPVGRFVAPIARAGFMTKSSETAEAIAGAPANGRVSWADLPRAAKAFRLAHAAFGVVNMVGLGYVWLAAIRRRRDKRLGAFVAVLCFEGAALVVGRGNCPFGPFQRSLGDPVPMFEWVLPPKAAKAAIPVLTVVTLVGFAGVALRPPPR